MVKKYYIERKNKVMEKQEKEQWLKLYSLADEIYELEPWKYIMDKEMLAYVDKDTNKLYYCIVLGHGGVCRGLVIIHEDNILDYMNIKNEEFEVLQLLNYQTGFMLTYPNAKAIADDDRIIPRELNISFKEEWIVFKFYQKGYLPSNLEIAQVEILGNILFHFISLFKHIKNNEFSLPLDKDKMLVRYYNEELKGYHNVVIPLLLPTPKYFKGEFDKDIVLEFKVYPSMYEIDILNFLPTAIGNNYKDNKYQLSPYMVVSDRIERKIIDFKVLDINDRINREEFLINIFKEKGLPKTIYVRDDASKYFLKDLEELKDISIIVTPKLMIIDKYISLLVKKNKTC